MTMTIKSLHLIHHPVQVFHVLACLHGFLFSSFDWVAWAQNDRPPDNIHLRDLVHFEFILASLNLLLIQKRNWQVIKHTIWQSNRQELICKFSPKVNPDCLEDDWPRLLVALHSSFLL